MIFLGREKQNVQDHRRRVLLLKPGPHRMGIAHLPGECSGLPPASLLRQSRIQKMVGERRIDWERARASSCLATPFKNTGLMLSLVYLNSLAFLFPWDVWRPQRPIWSCRLACLYLPLSSWCPPSVLLPDIPYIWPVPLSTFACQAPSLL